MSLFRGTTQKPADESRAFTLPPAFTATNSYASVGDPASGETSMQSIAVRSTVDLIASLVSELPAVAERNGRRTSGVPDNITDPGGDSTGREDWLYRLISSWLLRGNAYGQESSWDSRTGRGMTVDLMHPDDVRPVQSGATMDWYVKGRKIEGAERAAFVHHRVNPVAGRLLGLSPVSAHAATIGVSLSSTGFGRQWFTDGAHPSSMLTNQDNLTEESARTAKVRFMSAIHGTREPLVLGKGWDWKSIQVSPDESQFLETIGASEAQCARMFGPGLAEVMGYASGGSMTYANVVDRRQDLLVFSIGKWVRRAERVLSQLVPPSTVEIKLNRDALLETTTLQRYQAHALALAGWRTPNEIRAIEDLDPVAWGNEPLKPTTPTTGAPNADPA